MIHDTRDGLSMVGSRFQAATRRLLHAAAFLASVGAVTACAVDAGESVEEPTATAAESLMQPEPLGAEDVPSRGDAVQPGSTTMELGGDETSAKDGPGIFQTPPVKMRLYGRANVVAMVGLGSVNIGRYLGQTEYWRGVDALRITSDLQFEAAPLSGETESSIDSWLNPLIPAFDCRRPVSPTEWSRGVAVPQGTSYLLWTPHPDNAAEVLALQLVVNSQGRLASAIWYRSWAPAADGLAFRANTWRQTMRLLVNPDGSPATDPNLIQTADWHYIVMPLGLY